MQPRRAGRSVLADTQFDEVQEYPRHEWDTPRKQVPSLADGHRLSRIFETPHHGRIDSTVQVSYFKWVEEKGCNLVWAQSRC